MVEAAFSACHPEPAKRGEGSRNCKLRLLALATFQLQLRGPSLSAQLGMTDWEGGVL
jgi:hypothetical protein